MTYLDNYNSNIYTLSQNALMSYRNIFQLPRGSPIVM